MVICGKVFTVSFSISIHVLHKSKYELIGMKHGHYAQFFSKLRSRLPLSYIINEFAECQLKCSNCGPYIISYSVFAHFFRVDASGDETKELYDIYFGIVHLMAFWLYYKSFS